MKILALDQAIATGFCFGDPDGQKPIHGAFRAPKREIIGERLAYIFKHLGELMDRWEPDLVAHEAAFFPVGDRYTGGDPVPSKFSNEGVGAEVKRAGAAFNVKTIAMLQKIEGLVQLQAAVRAIPTECYGSRSWPPTILGMSVPRGSDVKALVRARCKVLGHSVESDDESDAIGIWMHAAYGPPAAARQQGDLLKMAAASL